MPLLVLVERTRRARNSQLRGNLDRKEMKNGMSELFIWKKDTKGERGDF